MPEPCQGPGDQEQQPPQSEAERDATPLGAVDHPDLGGRRASRRMVIVAATGVLGAIGAAACTAPAATVATTPIAGTRAGSTRSATAPSRAAQPGGASTSSATPTGGAASVLATSGPDLQSGSTAAGPRGPDLPRRWGRGPDRGGVADRQGPRRQVDGVRRRPVVVGEPPARARRSRGGPRLGQPHLEPPTDALPQRGTGSPRGE